MTISTETSILAFIHGGYYSVQLLADTAVTAGGWTILTGALPAGMTLDADDGIISGAPDLDAAGSVYKVQIQADDGSAGLDQIDLTFGVEFSEGDVSPGPEWSWNLLSNKVTFGEATTTDEKTGYAIFQVKNEDDFTVALELLKRGVQQDISVTAIEVNVRQFADEVKVDLATGVLQKLGSGQGDTYYRVGVATTDAELAAIIEDNTRAHDARVQLRAELELSYNQEVGAAEPADNVRTSDPFIIELIGELG